MSRRSRMHGSAAGTAGLKPRRGSQLMTATGKRKRDGLERRRGSCALNAENLPRAAKSACGLLVECPGSSVSSKSPNTSRHNGDGCEAAWKWQNNQHPAP